MMHGQKNIKLYHRVDLLSASKCHWTNRAEWFDDLLECFLYYFCSFHQFDIDSDSACYCEPCVRPQDAI